MKKTIEFLKKAVVFYLATTDENQPRVRPFGAVIEHQNRLYICTGNSKACFAQMKKNPKVEISATIDNNWIRLEGEVTVDSSTDAKVAMLEEYPFLKNMYSPTDGEFEVLYFTKGKSTFYSYTSDPVTEEL